MTDPHCGGFRSFGRGKGKRSKRKRLAGQSPAKRISNLLLGDWMGWMGRTVCDIKGGATLAGMETEYAAPRFISDIAVKGEDS